MQKAQGGRTAAGTAPQTRRQLQPPPRPAAPLTCGSEAYPSRPLVPTRPGTGLGAGWRTPPQAGRHCCRPGWPGCAAWSSPKCAGTRRRLGSRQTHSACSCRSLPPSTRSRTLRRPADWPLQGMGGGRAGAGGLETRGGQRKGHRLMRPSSRSAPTCIHAVEGQHPAQAGDGEAGLQTDVEASVTISAGMGAQQADVSGRQEQRGDGMSCWPATQGLGLVPAAPILQQGGVGAVQLDPLLVHHKHGHLRAVLAGHEHLQGRAGRPTSPAQPNHSQPATGMHH